MSNPQRGYQSPAKPGRLPAVPPPAVEPPPPESELMPGMPWYSATVVDESHSSLELTASGPPKVVAVWLRAVADQLDPPPRGIPVTTRL